MKTLHEFHLLDPQQAYCVCGWLSEVPDGWESLTLAELSDQWDSHRKDMQALELGWCSRHAKAMLWVDQDMCDDGLTQADFDEVVTCEDAAG